MNSVEETQTVSIYSEDESGNLVVMDIVDPSIEAEPLRMAQQNQEFDRLRRAIERLSDNLKSVIKLVDLEEMSISGAATTLGITENTLRVRRHRAMERLKYYMAVYFV